METIVIDSLRMAANDGIYPALTRFMKRDRARERAELDAADKMLDSLNVDSETRRQLEDWAVDVFASGSERGFRDGFRLAARLMVESLGEPEDPETGGKDDGS